jgi:hypothetical protein
MSELATRAHRLSSALRLILTCASRHDGLPSAYLFISIDNNVTQVRGGWHILTICDLSGLNAARLRFS